MPHKFFTLTWTCFDVQELKEAGHWKDRNHQECRNLGDQGFHASKIAAVRCSGNRIVDAFRQ